MIHSTWSNWRWWLVPGLAGAALFSLGSIAQAWDEPNGFPPDGASVQAPLNTLGYLQTRSDDLTLGSTLEIVGQLETQGPASIYSKLDITPSGGGQICFGAECQNSFDELYDSYLRLQPTPSDSGSVIMGDQAGLQGGGSINVTATQDTAVTVQAAAPDSLPGDPKVSYGLFGAAETGPTLPAQLSAGVYGLAKADSPFRVGIGGAAASTPSQVGNADLDPSSASLFESLVLGGVVSGVPIEVTCGDGICNNSETINNCPNDCFSIQNLAVGNLSDGTAEITWTTNAPATTLVQYGLTAGLGAAVGDASFTSDHAVTLSSLNENSTIYYRAVSRSASGLTRFSSILNFSTQIDTTPPADPSNLHLVDYAAPNFATISWYHTRQDNPGGSGFKEFIVYRNGTPLTTTTNRYLTDTNVTPNQNYTYRVTATDNRDNESGQSNGILVHIPTVCATSVDCTNPSYPNCCGELGCQTTCEGSSPAVLKGGSPAVLKAPIRPWEGGGGW